MISNPDPFRPLADALSHDGGYTSTTLAAGVDVARSTALDAALQFHRKADTDDPKTVVETATEFHAFLIGGDS